jgi:hypothetical protein
LFEFLLAGKNIVDQKLRSSENMVAMARFMTVVVFVLGGTSTRDFA